jgi:hypothetical protein
MLLYCVQFTFVSPREAPNGNTTGTVVVQTLPVVQLPRDGASITVSATPFSPRIVRGSSGYRVRSGDRVKRPVGDKDREPFQFTFNGFLKVDSRGRG